MKPDTLEKVVILARHGVRAAMSSPERLEMFSAKPWPKFSVPAGHLTPRGTELTHLLGAYYRDHYQSLGLLKEGDRQAVYYWASPTQRTIATAKALADVLTPGASNIVHGVPEGEIDPLFERVSKPDPALARASILGQVGGGLAAWSRSHRDAIETLDTLLMQCETKPCPPNFDKGKRRIGDEALSLTGDALPQLTGPEALASGITESLLMAWADGQDFEKLGWRGLKEDVLMRVFSLHQAEMDLRLRAPYLAQFTSSHLATRILATLEEGTGRSSRYAPLGGAERMVVIVGHDGTIVMLAGLLGIHWVTPGYQPDEVGPGGALIFERWRRGADGRQVIRLRYSGQTLTQLRESQRLTAQNPLASSPIFIPGGSEGEPYFDCALERFETLVNGLIDPAAAGR